MSTRELKESTRANYLKTWEKPRKIRVCKKNLKKLALTS